MANNKVYAFLGPHASGKASMVSQLVSMGSLKNLRESLNLSPANWAGQSQRQQNPANLQIQRRKLLKGVFKWQITKSTPS